MRSISSGLIGAAALTLALPVQADGVERVAIVVGANLAPTGRVPLRYAHEDAKAVAKVLTRVDATKCFTYYQAWVEANRGSPNVGHRK